MKRVTIRDVAALAGVSHSTVSRVLNGHPSIGARTRKAVHDACEALNYVPDITARGLAGQKTHTIGVIVPGVNLYGLATKVGLADNSIASGANKDLGNPLKPVNPAHNAKLQSLVNGLHARFIALVAQGRKMATETVRPLADGSIYLAQDAVNLRLIDDAGYEQTLPAIFAKLFDCTEEEVAIFRPAEQKPGLRAFLSEFPGALGRGIAAPLLDAPAARPALLYR